MRYWPILLSITSLTGLFKRSLELSISWGPLVGAVIAFTPLVNAHASDSEFLKGYAAAIIKLKFAGQVIEVSEEAPRHIKFKPAGCISPAERSEMETLLAESNLVEIVSWDMPSSCSEIKDPASSDPAVQPLQTKVLPTDKLPSRELFLPIIADPREPRSSLRYHRYHSDSSGTFNAGTISAGDSFPIIDWSSDDADQYQIGLEGGVFSFFNLDEDSNELVNADYLLGVPFMFRHGQWSTRLRVYHQSSHLGDEFILNNPEVRRINLSYEAIDLTGSYEWDRLRLYLGGGAILRSEPDLDPFLANSGLEYRWPESFFSYDTIFAGHFDLSEESDWNVNQSYQVGIAITNRKERELRFMFEYYDGFSPNGQFFPDRISYYGGGLFFDF